MLVQNACFDRLKDITDRVHIESPYCVSHPLYGKTELEPERIEQFQNLPVVLQNRYLSLQVRNFLHGIYFTGMNQPEHLTAAELSSPAGLVNNMAWGLNLDFYTQLHESNCGQGFFDPGWCVMGEMDGLLAVRKEDLTLYVERYLHLNPSEQSAVMGDAISIKMPPNRLKSGCYLAVSDVGLVEKSNTPTINIYFNLRPEGAAPVMHSLTQHLNALQIPFTFQVPYDPLSYDRYDSGILHCAKSDYGVMRSALSAIYTENSSYCREETPLFTKQLAPGVAVAEEPSHKFSAQEDFGLNRCQILTNGLLMADRQGEYTSEMKMVMILNQMYEHRIAPEFAYLDGDGEDIYADIL
jgi:HopA1 effector protein family